MLISTLAFTFLNASVKFLKEFTPFQLVFFRSFKMPITIVRPFNTYGPRQSARAIIPTII